MKSRAVRLDDRNNLGDDLLYTYYQKDTPTILYSGKDIILEVI